MTARGEGRPAGDDRGLSPVVGGVLLIAIVVALAGVLAVIVLGIGERPDPTPDVVLDLEEGEFAPVHRLRHEGGDDLGGTGKTEIRGIANPEVLHDRQLTAGNEEAVIPVVPTDETVEVVWYGDSGTSYVLRELRPSSYLEVSPDKDCGWADAETNGGTDPITVDGIVVTCDVVTQGDVDVVNGAVVVGNTTSTSNNVDLDESTVYGPVGADGDVDLDGTNVSGSVTSSGDDVVLTDDSTVGGEVRIGAGGNVDVDGGSSVGGTVAAGNAISIDAASVGGDVVSDGGTVTVSGSTIDGDVKSGGVVDISDATVSGDVYVDPGDFSCSNATIDGQDCGSYTPEDPDDY